MSRESVNRARRLFLTGACGFVAAPMLLTACRRAASPAPSPQATRETPAPEPGVPLHPPIPAEEPIVRVRIGRARPGQDEPIVIGEPGQLIRIMQPGLRPHHMLAPGPLAVTIGAGGWAIRDGLNALVDLPQFAPVQLLPTQRDERGFGLSLGERHYPEILRLVPLTEVDPEAFDIINHVRLESYLPGVVARELYNHWHLETHAAQAIAARSFACAEHAFYRERRHFDMTDSQSSQVYAGTVTHRRSLESVAMTRGMVLAHDGMLVPAYYSSCCGGVPARAIDAISPNPINAIAPLDGSREHDVCTTSPVYEWSIALSVHGVTRRLNAFGNHRQREDLQNLVTVVSIEVAAVNLHGRPTLYTISDLRGHRVQLPAETLRQALNYVGQGFQTPRQALRSSNFTAKVEGNEMIFRGRGFGHGVGMCQHGAEIRARAGMSFRDILRWYYPGADIVTAYA